jgi:hypothetical protein
MAGPPLPTRADSSRTHGFRLDIESSLNGCCIPQARRGHTRQHNPILRISQTEGACIGQMGSLLSATWAISHHILHMRAKRPPIVTVSYSINDTAPVTARRPAFGRRHTAMPATSTRGGSLHIRSWGLRRCACGQRRARSRNDTFCHASVSEVVSSTIVGHRAFRERRNPQLRPWQRIPRWLNWAESAIYAIISP